MSGQGAIPLALLALIGTPLAARAQGAPDSAHSSIRCGTAPPAPRCRVVLLTDFGPYVGVALGGGSDGRLVEDVGLLLNVGPRTAVGATFMVTVDQDGLFSTGPALRYRRWLSGSSSLDLAIGVRGAANTIDHGAVMALLKYNTGPYLGFALRPEIVEACVVSGGWCRLSNAPTTTRLRGSIGFEIGSWPAVVVLLVGGFVGLVALLANPPSF